MPIQCEQNFALERQEHILTRITALNRTSPTRRAAIAKFGLVGTALVMLVAPVTICLATIPPE